MNVLITGSRSYIGSNIKKWLIDKGHYVEELEVRSKRYKDFDYSGFNTIVHVAAIVHKAKENISWEEYYDVNVMLTYNIAKLAKLAGVKQFIFFSTMGVYGQRKKLPNGNIVDKYTKLNPIDNYGKSKLMAEQKLGELSDTNFKIVIIRPPNVYGMGCPGNYISKFGKVARIFPVFPYAYEYSKQSFLYIDNLCELIFLIILNQSQGLFLPQDERQISSVELIKIIADGKGYKIYFSKFLGYFIRLFRWTNIVKKVYGGVSYDSILSSFDIGDYNVVSLNTGVTSSIGE